MRTRVFADLNPRYPAKGERRWTVFLCEQGELSYIQKSFSSRKSAELCACRLQVDRALASLGIVVASSKLSQS